MRVSLPSSWILVASLLVSTFAQASVRDDSELVRVRIATIPGQLQISGVGLRFQNLSQPYRPVAVSNSTSAEVRLMPKEAQKLWALRLGQQSHEHLFGEKFLMVQGNDLRINGQALPERILLTQGAKGSVDVVGVMSLDEYLVGVISSEMPKSWPLETLKAQAVAARSYATAIMQERHNENYHLESSVLDQVFRHIAEDDRNDPKIQNALRAVEETKGIRLFGSNKKVLKAFYHADCGGKTVSAKEVWKSGVDSGITTDASCPTSPRASWTLTLRKEELAKRLGFKAIEDIEMVQDEGHRVHSVKVHLPDGSSRLLAANDFRGKLGFQELRSTLFDLNKTPSGFYFQGRGFGHGVGLCQWGSRALGKKGFTYKQILAHYYPLAKLY